MNLKAKQTLLALLCMVGVSGYAQSASDLVKQGGQYCEEENYTKAVECFRKAAEMGDAEGQDDLGGMYLYGAGVQQNNQIALIWFRKSAAQGFAEGQYDVGYMYHYGLGVEQDYNEAYKWYSLAVKQGNTHAEKGMGDLYNSGNGVKQDYAEAAKWYQKAAQKNDPEAQDALGMLYWYGNGVEKNLSTAASLHEKAAKQGLAIAQFHLGYCYDHGCGVKINKKSAIYWYSIASDNGIIDAKYALKAMYDKSTVYSYGLAPSYKNGKWGFVDTNSNVVIPYEYEDVEADWDGRAWYTYVRANEAINYARVKKSGRWGCIDVHNQIVIPFEYSSINIFSDDGTTEVKKGDRWGRIDIYNKVTTPFMYDELRRDRRGFMGELRRGCCYAKKNGKWGVVNGKNNVIPFEYDTLCSIYFRVIGGRVYHILAKKNGKIGIIGNNNEVLIPFEYEDIDLYHNTYVTLFMKKGKWGIIKHSHKYQVVIPFEYDEIVCQEEGLPRNGYMGRWKGKKNGEWIELNIE